MEDIKKESILAFCKGADLDADKVKSLVSADYVRGWNAALRAIVWFVTGGEEQ